MCNDLGYRVVCYASFNLTSDLYYYFIVLVSERLSQRQPCSSCCTDDLFPVKGEKL